jgi:hypothetical protein
VRVVSERTENAQKLFCEVQQGGALQNVIALLSCASAEIQLRMVNVLLMLSAMSGTLLLLLPHAHALHDTVGSLLAIAIAEEVRRKLVARHAINRLMRLLRATSNPQMQLAIAQVLCNLAVDRSSLHAPAPVCALVLTFLSTHTHMFAQRRRRK